MQISSSVAWLSANSSGMIEGRISSRAGAVGAACVRRPQRVHPGEVLRLRVPALRAKTKTGHSAQNDDARQRRLKRRHHAKYGAGHSMLCPYGEASEKAPIGRLAFPGTASLRTTIGDSATSWAISRYCLVRDSSSGITNSSRPIMRLISAMFSGCARTACICGSGFESNCKSTARCCDHSVGYCSSVSG